MREKRILTAAILCAMFGLMAIASILKAFGISIFGGELWFETSNVFILLAIKLLLLLFDVVFMMLILDHPKAAKMTLIITATMFFMPPLISYSAQSCLVLYYICARKYRWDRMVVAHVLITIYGAMIALGRLGIPLMSMANASAIASAAWDYKLLLPCLYLYYRFGGEFNGVYKLADRLRVWVLGFRGKQGKRAE